MTKSNIFLKKPTKEMSHFFKSLLDFKPCGGFVDGDLPPGAARRTEPSGWIGWKGQSIVTGSSPFAWIPTGRGKKKIGEGEGERCVLVEFLGLILAIFARQWSASGSRTRQHPPPSAPPSQDSPKSSTAWIQLFPALCIDWKIFILYIFLFNGC